MLRVGVVVTGRVGGIIGGMVVVVVMHFRRVHDGFHVVVGIHLTRRGGRGGRRRWGGNVTTKTTPANLEAEEADNLGEEGAHIGQVPEHDGDPEDGVNHGGNLARGRFRPNSTIS